MRAGALHPNVVFLPRRGGGDLLHIYTASPTRLLPGHRELPRVDFVMEPVGGDLLYRPFFR
jgi:hypothetical protein